MSRAIAWAVLVLTFALFTKAKAMTENQKYLDEAHQRAKAFETELEPERLREASIALENVVLVVEVDPKTRAQVRSACLIEWLHLLQLLDRFLDPNFNPRDVPPRLLQPPLTRAGVVYPPGADPTLIDDPQARAEYEEAIQANRTKSQQYRLQTHLSRLQETLPRRAEALIRSAYTSSKRDQQELRDAIDKIITDPQRKERLLGLW